AVRLGIRHQYRPGCPAGRRRRPPARNPEHQLEAGRGAQAAHPAVARQHLDPVVLPQPGHDGRADDPARDGPPDRQPGIGSPAMKLQVNTMLALYSVIEFATDPQRHIPAAEIAEKYSVSPHHLAKVLAELARAGIVESVRGVGGGYRFTANVRRLTLMDVILLFEDFAPPAPPRRDAGGPTPADQALEAVLSEIDQIAKATFSSITLATMLQLVARQQQHGAALNGGAVAVPIAT